MTSLLSAVRRARLQAVRNRRFAWTRTVISSIASVAPLRIRGLLRIWPKYAGTAALKSAKLRNYLLLDEEIYILSGERCSNAGTSLVFSGVQAVAGGTLLAHLYRAPLSLLACKCL